jgi:ATP-dependent exoDNAse (exonuclease V) alpha subunit
MDRRRPISRVRFCRGYPHLNAGQLATVERVLASRDGVQEFDGVAGAGKTTALAAVRDAAERAGYRVQGFAPTSRAAELLHDAGIDSKTLQRHLAQTPDGDERQQRHLYVLDESSLSSTVQVHQFLKELDGRDRVLLVGDVRQHEAIDAGIPYQQLQHAGVSIARLRTIVRQQDPDLRAVVEHLAEGQVAPAIHALDDQGRVHHIEDRDERYKAIAKDYASDPTRTLVVSPDNKSRADLNAVIHEAMQVKGNIDATEYPIRVLVARQELTGVDRQWASRYEVDDVVRYTKASKLVGVKAGDYARVIEVRPDSNQIRVTRDSGGTVTYDPRRAHGVTVYLESERQLAVGDRLQFTAPDRGLKVANRQLATVEAIGPAGELRITLDKKDRQVVVDSARKHVDLGYVLTSHSSQGQTADRVLVHVDTDHLGERLVNRRMAYVSLSRSRHDARIYTNDPEQLVHALSRDVSRQAALRPDQVQAPTTAATARPEAKPEVSP